MIKKLINKLKMSKIARNSAWMIVSTIIQMIISLFVNIVVARYLGVENYGIINYGLSYINFFSGVCSLGLGTITIKFLVNENDKHGEIIGTCIFMRIICSIISIFIISFLVFVLKGNDKIILFATFIQSLSLLFDSVNTINLWYQYKLQSKTTAIITFIVHIIILMFKLLLVALNKNVLWFAFSYCLSAIIMALFLFISFKKNNNIKFSFSLKKGLEMLSQSYHFIISTLMVALYAQVDKIMIGSMIEDISAVGLYSVSITIVSLWSFLPSAIINSFKSSLLEIRKVSYSRYLVRLKQLYSIILWLSIFYSVFIIIFGKLIILILYGSEYIGGLLSLKIAVLGTAFSYFGVIREFWLVCEGKQKYAKWFALSGVLVNVVLNYILIPILGIAGAAIATTFTQITTGLIAPLIFNGTRESVLHLFKGMLFKFD